MKKMTLVLVIALVFLGTSVCFADTYVKGYFRKDGTYVSPHYRSDANGTKSDNWSTKGNVNPYTGKKGYKSDDSGYGSIFGKKKGKSIFGN